MIGKRNKIRSYSIGAMMMLSLESAVADRYNGFDVSNATIPVAEMLRGGPPRDGIPSINQPRFISTAAADFMKDDDEVVSVTFGEETRAYPLRILVWHEMVNDELDGKPIAVTYCPLCGTAMVFSRRIGGRILDFGVSGLLYQSDVLMYDRQTDSLWSQLAMASVAGSLVNTPLEWLPAQQMTWAAWKESHPNGKVLSTQTGFARNYSGTAYADYKRSASVMFPVPEHRTELPQKEWVFGVLMKGKAYAFPVRLLAKQKIVFAGMLKITYDPESGLAQAKDFDTGNPLPVVKVYWFAWQAFYPKTKLCGSAIE